MSHYSTLLAGGRGSAGVPVWPARSKALEIFLEETIELLEYLVPIGWGECFLGVGEMEMTLLGGVEPENNQPLQSWLTGTLGHR